MAHDLEKKWRSKDVQLQESVDFSAMLLSNRVLMGLTKAGFKKPSPIQLEAIPIAKIGQDILVQAKSGTGKTLVFVITALEILRHKLFRPQVMILVPTREIAAQICSVVKSVGSTFPKLTCSMFIGGLSVYDDIDKALTCQIVVGTPGRLKQLVSVKSLPVNSVRLLVFDEVDQLLQMSFKKDIEDIFNCLPKDIQVIATSATYPARYRKTLFGYLRPPCHLACLNRELALLGLVHYATIVKSNPMSLLFYKMKLSALEEILKKVKFSQCLVFCNSLQRVEVLYKDIKKWGFSTTYISSAKEQSDRLKAIDRLRHFKCKVLVSTDVTARGIDAENVDIVINFDWPFNTETYMHRVGRAGRYGSVGIAISIIEEKQLTYLERMETSASFKTYKLPDPVTEDLIQKARLEEGEYIIKPKEIESSDDDEKAVLDESKTDISVENRDEKIETADNKNAEEEIVHLNGSHSNESDCVSAQQIVPERSSTENNACYPAKDTNGNIHLDIKPMLDQKFCDGENLSEKDEDNEDSNSISSGAQAEESFIECDKFSKGELNFVVKNFIEQYESNRKMELLVSGDVSEPLFEECLEGLASSSTINNVNFKKGEYFYDVFKKYQSEKEQHSKTEIPDVLNFSLNGIDSTLSESNKTCSQNSDVNTLPCPTVEQNADSSVENSSSLQESVRKLNCESTPKLKIPSKEENTSKLNMPKPELTTSNRLFQCVSDESDSDHNELIAETVSDGSQCFSSLSESEESSSSSSCSSSSSEDLSEDSSSSSSEDLSEDNYRSNRRNCHAGKHNPSLVASSSENLCDFKETCSRSDHKRCSGFIPRSRHSEQNYEPSHCSYSTDRSHHSPISRNEHRRGRHVACNRSHRSQHYTTACGRNCFLPSEHRCHCRTVFCNQMPVCSHWHRTFYNQWQQLQNCINSALL